ncbi:cache domain-containing sensor histidine kinase [Paenibacillus contaminans]|uniref:histidine kinase n=1 Tax=Paenibacillus contaminans TaxID=450362 RepID=A0A329MPK9_9BACL|nr:sensor histidine kinase [Paenibacillus contaminans]RAV21901.1 sensor histidine kinase [Paenibacillus contaminans]
MSLNKKMFVAFMAFIIAPLFVLGLVSYYSSQQLIEKKYGEQTELTLKAIGRNVTYVFKEANYFSDFWMVKSEIQSILHGLNSGDGGSDGSAVHLVEYESELRRTLLTYAPIQSVTLYGTNGYSVHAGRGVTQMIPYEKLNGSDLYADVWKRNGVPKWIGPAEAKELAGEGRDFFQLRVVKDYYTFDTIGLMVARYRFSELERIFDSYFALDDSIHRYLIVKDNGTILFDSRRSMEGSDLLSIVSGQLALSRTIDSTKSEVDGTETIVSHARLDMEELGIRDWKLVFFTPWEAVSGELTAIMRWVAFITLLCIGSALIFNLVFVRNIIQFILRIVSSMRRVERGDLTARVEHRGDDETTVLAHGFNSMTERIGGLLEEVKVQQNRKNRAELMLMQAQIKPHFLFNTLESINVMAVQNEGKQVSQMVRRLGNLLRISMHPKEEIMLKQELEHLKSYLDIQMFRFEDSFDYEIDIPQSLMDCPVLKLTLQPLVENSIQHGFEGIEYRGHIRIYAEDDEDRFALIVEDNGLGIPPSRLAGFRYHADREVPLESGANERSGEPDMAQPLLDGGEKGGGERSGLGLSNVADRIRIRYGVRYGLFLCSEEGKGTIVKCVLPKIGGGTNASQSASGG